MADKDVGEAADASEDRESHPGTEPFVPDFDTGEPSVPFVPDFDDDSEPFSLPGLAGLAGLGKSPAAPRKEAGEERDESEPPSSAADAEEDSATETPVAPVTVPGRYQYLKWWKFVLVILGVWFVAAEVGLSLFYWWFHTIDRTWPVFTVLVYVVACSVAGVLLAMVEGRPMIAALSLTVMSGPFASVAAAAPLYGYYYCERTGPCLLGVVPY